MKEKIETIFIRDDGVTLGIDKHGNLYWNGHPIVTERRVELSKMVNASIVVASLSTFVMAVIAVLGLIIGLFAWNQ